MMMVRYMCGVTLKDKMSCGELRQRLGMDNVLRRRRKNEIEGEESIEEKQTELV
jgi:hypothetical protein